MNAPVAPRAQPADYLTQQGEESSMVLPPTAAQEQRIEQPGQGKNIGQAPIEVRKAQPITPGTDWEPVKSIEPASIADSAAMQSAINNFRGTFLGKNELNNEVWQDPTGRRYVLQQGANPWSDIRYYQNQGPTEVRMNESQYMPAVQQMAAQYGGLDPWTNQPYVGRNGRALSPADLARPENMGEALALAGKIQAFHNSPALDPGQLENLQGQENVAGAFQKMKDDMASLNNKDIDKTTQINKAFMDMTDQDFVGKGLGEDKRAALQDIQQQIQYLHDLGVPVLGKPQKGEAPEMPGFAATGWGIVGSVATSVARNVMTTGQSLAGLRGSIPQALNAVRKNYYETVSNLANQHYRVDQYMRDLANEYAGNLKAEGLGRNTPVQYSARIKEGPETPAPVQPKGPPKPFLERDITEIPGMIGDVLKTQIPGTSWLSKVLPGQPVKPKPQPPPAPVAKPTPGSASVGNLPSYASQDELDAAGHPPGTVFHWQPTDSEYVVV
jgi:hypothetical protein